MQKTKKKMCEDLPSVLYKPKPLDATSVAIIIGIRPVLNSVKGKDKWIISKSDSLHLIVLQGNGINEELTKL